jgi:hypothetical protein
MGRAGNITKPPLPLRNTEPAVDDLEWTRLAVLVRQAAEADGGATPVSRKIAGDLWIAFHEVVLDEIADDTEWYVRIPENKPIFVIGSGAVKATKGRGDEALVRLARQLSPFNKLLEAQGFLARAA